jgi:hypothetical protein
LRGLGWESYWGGEGAEGRGEEQGWAHELV